MNAYPRRFPGRALFLIASAAACGVYVCEFLIQQVAGRAVPFFFARDFPYVFNALLIAWVMCFLFALSNRLIFSVCFGLVPSVFLSLAHALKLRILHEVLFVSDFLPSVLLALLRVLPGLDSVFLAGTVLGFALSLAGFYFLWRLRRFKFGHTVLTSRWILFLFVPAVLAASSWVPGADLEKIFGLKYDVYNRHRNYRRLGLHGALFLGWRDMISVRRPANYSRREIHRLLKSSSQSQSQSQSRPQPRSRPEVANTKSDIILVLAETFWDPMKFPALGVRPDPIPFFRSMLRSGRGGEIVVPTLGGGTVKTEFEVLTGLSSRFVDGYPYSTAVSRRIASVPSALRSRGYRTTSIHGYFGWFYNRNRAMPLLGFDRFIHRGHMLTDVSLNPGVHENMLDARFHIRDDFLLGVARLQAELHSPAFVYVSTYGTHGPYLPIKNLEKIKFDVAPNISGDARRKLVGNLMLLRRADNAFRALTRYYRKRSRRTGRPVSVIVFGDHLPARVYLPVNMAKLAGRSKDLLYRTPYFVWRSSETRNASGSAYPPLMSANYLAPLILREAGIGLPPRFQFLESRREQVPVFSLLKKAAGQPWGDRLPEGPTYKVFRRDYYLLQYDLLYGEGFALR